MCLSGCSQFVDFDVVRQTNAFRILRRVDEDGRISIDYVFPVNSLILQESGVQAKQVENFKFYLSTFVNALAQNNKSRANEGVTDLISIRCLINHSAFHSKQSCNPMTSEP